MLDLIADGTISGKIAKDLFEIVWSEGGDPRAIVEARGMKQVTDLGAIEKMVDEIIAQESRQGRRRQDQSEGDRLVRRPGDEGVRRQSEPASGQRAAQAEARALRRGASRAPHIRSNTRREIWRRPPKISARADHSTANHLHPIRSFLIDSGIRRGVFAPCCEKSFAPRHRAYRARRRRRNARAQAPSTNKTRRDARAQ